MEQNLMQWQNKQKTKFSLKRNKKQAKLNNKKKVFFKILYNKESNNNLNLATSYRMTINQHKINKIMKMNLINCYKVCYNKQWI